MVMCIVTITLPVQSQENERSCILLPLHYLYKVRKMSGHVYCYHYTTCTKPGKWAVMCIVTITLPVKRQDNERSCVLLPLHYLYKAMKMNGHVYCYHYTTCTKPRKWAVMCIVTITLPVQSQVNERLCVLLPLHYLSKAKKMSGHVYCYHYTTCTKPGQWAFMCIVTITLPVQRQVNKRSYLLLPLHYLYKAR
jgi:predicted Co/Zn/Cd cation transporter (cation efflux family)